MNEIETNNFAFIDSQNLNIGIKTQGWKLDYKRFRKYLLDKYQVSKAFIFIGFIPTNKLLYRHLEEAGYICIFKPTLKLPNGKVKGNVDAELVLQTMIEYSNFNKAIIVSGDGDFHCLVKYLLKKNKFKIICIPNQNRYSALLKQLSKPNKNILVFMNHLRHKLSNKQKKRLSMEPTPVKTSFVVMYVVYQKKIFCQTLILHHYSTIFNFKWGKFIY